MAQVGDAPAPPCTISTPVNLQATAGKRSITLTWDLVTGAEGYNVYYSQNGKYTFKSGTTATTYKDTRLNRGQTYIYVVTAYRTCADGTIMESDYSNEASETIR